MNRAADLSAFSAFMMGKRVQDSMYGIVLSKVWGIRMCTKQTLCQYENNVQGLCKIKKKRNVKHEVLCVFTIQMMMSC